MITETQLAKALEDIMPYVVEAVFNCDRTHCDQPLCVDCRGDHAAKENASEVVRLVNKAGQVLKEWKNAMPTVCKPGCNCEPDDWFDAVIPPVCDEYAEGGDEYCDYCGTCEHNKECHQPKPETPV